MAEQKNKLTPLGKDIKKKLADKDMSGSGGHRAHGIAAFHQAIGIAHNAAHGTAICIVLDLDPERYRVSA
mgnify:CR=1 FL=1